MLGLACTNSDATCGFDTVLLMMCCIMHLIHASAAPQPPLHWLCQPRPWHGRAHSTHHSHAPPHAAPAPALLVQPGGAADSSHRYTYIPTGLMFSLQWVCRTNLCSCMHFAHAAVVGGYNSTAAQLQR
jgi:hypothetical protein